MARIYHSNQVYENMLKQLDKPEKSKFSISSIATMPLRCTWRCLKISFYAFVFIMGLSLIGMGIFLVYKVSSFLAPVTGFVAVAANKTNECFQSPSFDNCLAMSFPIPHYVGEAIAKSIVGPSKSRVARAVLSQHDVFAFYKSECNNTFDMENYHKVASDSSCCWLPPLSVESGMDWDFVLYCKWNGDFNVISECPCEDVLPSTTTPRKSRGKFRHVQPDRIPLDEGT